MNDPYSLLVGWKRMLSSVGLWLDSLDQNHGRLCEWIAEETAHSDGLDENEKL